MPNHHASGFADDLAQFQIVVKFLLDAADVSLAVTGGLQFVGDVGEGAKERYGGLVERGALRFPFRQFFRDFGVAAKVWMALLICARL